MELVDEALERAWQRRHEWQALGAAAGRAIRERHSLSPGEDFAARVLALAAGRGVVPLRRRREAAADRPGGSLRAAS